MQWEVVSNAVILFSVDAGVTELGIPKSVRTRRLMKELHDIQKSQTKDSPFTVELINDNLFDWHVRLYSIDSESELAADMRQHGIGHINLQLTFPENFPFVPPFMRVVSPRIEKGFVMEGGAICMELLTPRGWASAYTIEAIVMQFAASIVKGQVCIAATLLIEFLLLKTFQCLNLVPNLISFFYYSKFCNI